MKELLHISPQGRKENILQGEKFRFTLLTPCLIRLEYCEDGIFEDRATQTVLNRSFAPVAWRRVEKAEGFELFTDRMHVMYDGKKFSSSGLAIDGQGGLHAYGTHWRYGENKGNLKGTARTLDEADGACELEDGILSVRGCAVLDDSKSLLLTEEGWIEGRKQGILDLYVFVYGNDYEAALADYYTLTGRPPMLPRFALGNWWSRYYTYTQDSYQELMDRFQAEQVPFTVAVIDMDWHLRGEAVDPRYGSDWTGYTWDRELFPDPEGFLSGLHERGMRTTLNLHPADGIRAYEEAYPVIAGAMGINTQTEEPVIFDVGSRDFMEAYFTHVLHPLEDQGVDFWWIDWQQGSDAKIPGLDPLWMLNHCHYLDNARDGKRPLTFSRYAGPGSHRYPVGFSGDTVMTWESLDFQPYFTSTASNIGYGWWSHDIGGHMHGYKDNVMAARWVQFGVFSPINRLHSCKNEFNGKEPWRYPHEIHQVMNEFLRLRHKLLPYLYTMNYRAYREGRPLVTPMYYQYPRERAAYGVKNQYFFGDGLMAAPITTPQIERLHVGKVRTWLPGGIWHDFFTGIIYSGGRHLEMYRDIASIPVLAKAGAIIPMTEEIQGKEALRNPETLELRVFGGADGAFTLYEDDNETVRYLEQEAVFTPMSLDWEAHTFTIEGAQGHTELIPRYRTYTVSFCGVEETEVSVTVDGAEAEDWSAWYDKEPGQLKVVIRSVSIASEIRVELGDCRLRKNPVRERIYDFLNQAEIPFWQKEQAYRIVSGELTAAAKLAELQAMELGAELTGCVTELVAAYE